MNGPVTLDISEVIGRFPTFRVALILARDICLRGERTVSVDSFVRDCETQAAAAMTGLELAALPELAVWREAYKALGVKKTSYRSSVERLLKAIQRGSGLPRVNPLVDVYNAISARYRLPIGADDLALVALPLAFRYARPGHSFIALGDVGRTPDPPKACEVVYADAEKCLCRRWNWYQDARSACSLTTENAVLTVQSLSHGHDSALTGAVQELCKQVMAACGGICDFAIADSAVSVATVRS